MIGDSVPFAAAAASMPGLPAAVKAAADAADDVDRKSRFPSEAIDLLKDARLLSCSLPTDLGGRSYGIAELAVIARALGGACTSAGMVFATHHAQALSLAHHAHEGQIARLTSRIAADESLLASATTGDHNWRRRPLVDLRRDQRRRPGRSGKERPRRFRFGQAARAHYARNKLLGLLPLIISVVWRRESRRRSRSSGTRRWGLPSARRTIGCGRSGPTWAGIPSRQSPATEQGAETILGPAPGAGGSESRPLPG